MYRLATLLPISTSVLNYFLLLSVVPLLGSLITEPAAMTLAALMLRDSVFSKSVSERLKYATLGEPTAPKLTAPSAHRPLRATYRARSTCAQSVV